MSAFPPPTASLVSGIKIAVVLLVPLVAVAIITGGDGVLAATMALLSVTTAIFCDLRQQAVLLPGVVLTGFLATAAYGNPVAVVGVVVLACVVAGLMSRVSAGVYGVVPIAASVLALDQPRQSPTGVAIVMAVMCVYVAIVVAVLKVHFDAVPVTWDVAIRHALVMAVACGGATAVAVHYQWPKSYWLVMTLAVVLRPYATESLVKSERRVVGTIAGAIVAAALSPLPRSLQAVFAAACLALLMTYMIEKNYVLQVTFTTPLVIFLVSTGTVDDTLTLDGLRVLYTVGAAVVGGLLSLALARQQIDETAQPA